MHERDLFYSNTLRLYPDLPVDMIYYNMKLQGHGANSVWMCAMGTACRVLNEGQPPHDENLRDCEAENNSFFGGKRTVVWDISDQ